MKWYPLAHLAAVTMSMFLRRMYLRTIGHRFMQMMVYFLVMNSKRCKVAHGLACLLIKLRNDSFSEMVSVYSSDSPVQP